MTISYEKTRGPVKFAPTASSFVYPWYVLKNGGTYPDPASRVIAVCDSSDDADVIVNALSA